MKNHVAKLQVTDIKTEGGVVAQSQLKIHFVTYCGHNKPPQFPNSKLGSDHILSTKAVQKYL
jgi:hypothetical protein